MTLRGWYRTALGALLLLVAFIAEAQTAACPNGILSYRRSGAGQFSSANACPTNGQPEEFRTCIETWANLPANSNRFGSRGPVTIRNANGYASSGSLEIWAYDFNSTQGTTSNYSFLNITVNCGTCPAGTVRSSTTGLCQAPPPPACQAGQIKATGVLRNADHNAQGLACIDGCRVNDSTPGPRVTVGLLLVDTPTQLPSGLTAGRSDSQWSTTGQNCDGTEPAPAASTDPATVSTRDGDSIQTGGAQTPANCGTFNGEYVCVGSEPANGCITTAGGQAFCSSTAPVPPTPRDPANPSQAARPVGQVTVTRDGVTTVTNYYNVNQAIVGSNATTTGGAGGGGSTGGTTGGGTTTGGVGGGSGGGTGGNCGAPGQPLCKVDIDETGVPESFDLESLPGAGDDPGLTAQDAANGLDSAIADGTSQSEGKLSGLFGMARDMLPGGGSSGGGCQSIPYTGAMPFSGTISSAFPTPVGCDLFKVVQAILGWALAGFTLITCLLRVRQTLSGAIV